MKVKKSARKAGRKVGRVLYNVMDFTGDAIGLAALRLGKKDIAYRTIMGARAIGEESQKLAETTFNSTGDILDGMISSMDMEHLKDRADKVKEEAKKMTHEVKHFTLEDFREVIKDKADLIKDKAEGLRDKAESFHKTETRIYGESGQFYNDSDKIEPEEVNFPMDEPVEIKPPVHEESDAKGVGTEKYPVNTDFIDQPVDASRFDPDRAAEDRAMGEDPELRR